MKNNDPKLDDSQNDEPRDGHDRYLVDFRPDGLPEDIDFGTVPLEEESSEDESEQGESEVE